MRRLPTLALIITAALALAAPNVKKELERTFKEITNAVKHKDAAAFSSYLADDFTSTDDTGKVHTRDEVIHDWTGMMQGFKDFKWVRHIRSIQQDGNVYVTVTESKLTALIPGRDSKEHKFEFDAISQDRWEKIDDHWKDHAAKLLKVRSLFDGHETHTR